MQWIASAKYLTPPTDSIDLVSNIIHHYSTPLSMALRGHRPRYTNELFAVLTKFEESISFCENNRPRQNIQQHHQNERRVHDNQQEYQGGYNRGNQQMNPPANPTDAPIH